MEDEKPSANPEMGPANAEMGSANAEMGQSLNCYQVPLSEGKRIVCEGHP